MRRLSMLIPFVLFMNTLFAGEGEFAVSRIPQALLKDANAVLRVEEVSFEIASRSKAVYKSRWAVTILNEKGDRWSSFLDYYTKFRKIESVEGTLYDALGKDIRKMKMKDAEDRSGVDESSLMDDYRIKRHNFYHSVYPYTVEYEVEIIYYSTLFFPDWMPLGGELLSVERSSFTMICPNDYEFRYKAVNFNTPPVATQKGSSKLSIWSVSNMPAIKKEPYAPSLQELVPVVYFGPTEFQVEEYKANMSSWQDFGKFVYALKQGKDVLPDPVKQQVHSIADGIADPKKKIAALYEYLQKNTRYISIQLGIGGWQPFDAKYVAGKSYGDCKALTNYMFSLLKEAGITSYYTLVTAGRGATGFLPDFPSSQFNHVILCVPLGSDTTWLECTSQTKPAGYLGGFTCNRFALMVDESGGKLIRTSKYDIDDNLQQRRITGVLDEYGTLSIKAVTRYGGLQQDDVHGMIHELSKDKVKEYLHEMLDFATYDITRFDYKEEKSKLPSISEELDITVSNYANFTGKRLFIIPNAMTRSNRKMLDDPDRKYDIRMGDAYRDIDSVAITLPDGYTPESMPQDISLTSPFGTYNCSVKLVGNQLVYYRRIDYLGGSYSSNSYGEMVKFFNAVYKNDRNKVVLVKAN